jgi:D-glycero-alpha-D-manno-heptose-7-phosphate kinase
MRFVKAPLRISIGGGGTDLPFYYREKGADLTFATIDKYIYITAHSGLKNRYKISLEETREEADRIEDIKEEYVKTVLETAEVDKTGLNISSSSEVPSETGLGSSGSFTVALLKAVETWTSEDSSRKELAEKAFDIEHDMLGKPCGKQDQYASAFGGLKRLQIDRNGEACIEKLDVDVESMKKLEERLMLFYTEERRYSEDVLEEQKREMDRDYSKKEKMDRIKEIGTEIRKALENGDIPEYGQLLHRHWETKKKFTEKMTNPNIDRMYSDARDKGAEGGKIVGAGGGGFLMLFAEKEHQDEIKKTMRKHNAKHMEFKFEDSGCEVLYEK